MKPVIQFDKQFIIVIFLTLLCTQRIFGYDLSLLKVRRILCWIHNLIVTLFFLLFFSLFDYSYKNEKYADVCTFHFSHLHNFFVLEKENFFLGFSSMKRKFNNFFFSSFFCPFLYSWFVVQFIVISHLIFCYLMMIPLKNCATHIHTRMNISSRWKVCKFVLCWNRDDLKCLLNKTDGFWITI